MREIIFKGKSKESGEWIYGVPCYFDDSRHIVKYLYNAEGGYVVGAESEEVIPDTIGQYTGLTDKNGTRIFEGDIVRLIDKFVDFRTYAVIEFGNPNGLYNWGWQLRPLGNKPFAVEILHWVDMEESGAYIEVIGNIHDNPELLKGVRE